MRTHHVVLTTLTLLAVAAVATAERPPEKRDEAELVVVGKVHKISTMTEKFGKTGEMTYYTAKVVVDKVEKGDGAKAGDTVSVTWFHVTKQPEKGFVGAFGHDYGLKEKDEATFWLMKRRGKWEVIYNKDGVEKKK